MPFSRICREIWYYLCPFEPWCGVWTSPTVAGGRIRDRLPPVASTGVPYGEKVVPPPVAPVIDAPSTLIMCFPD